MVITNVETFSKMNKKGGRDTVIQYEREQHILSYLEGRHACTVAELARTVFASEASVRRDLARLEKEGIVCRVYGGVVLSKYQNASLPLSVRRQENVSQKERIAQEAAALVPDGATVFLDASSTAGRVGKYLSHVHRLRIITNSATLVETLSDTPHEIWLTGGRYLRENRAFVGAEAENFVRSINIDWLFFSSQGLTLGGEITDSSEAETSLRRVLLTRSRHKFFLCDSSKLGVRRMFTVCSRDDVDRIICDKEIEWEDKP